MPDNTISLAKWLLSFERQLIAISDEVAAIKGMIQRMSPAPPTKQPYPDRRPASVLKILQESASEADLPTKDLMTNTRGRGGDFRTSGARRSAICKLRAQGHSLPQIGRWMGLHHTSVLHHLQVAAKSAKG